MAEWPVNDAIFNAGCLLWKTFKSSAYAAAFAPGKLPLPLTKVFATYAARAATGFYLTVMLPSHIHHIRCLNCGFLHTHNLHSSHCHGCREERSIGGDLAGEVAGETEAHVAYENLSRI